MSIPETTNVQSKTPWITPTVVLATVASGLIVRWQQSLSMPLAYSLAADLGEAINSFDYRIIGFLNQFAQRSWTVDKFFYLLDSNSLATAPLLIAFWWAWFKRGEDRTRNRELLLSGIIGCFLALFASRLLAISLPFRERPLRNPLLHFQLPYGVHPDRLLGWSSFPSDHGALWFALATSILLVSRRAGTFLFIYVSFTLCVARIYLGIHYPVDILAGGLLGIGMVGFARCPAVWTVGTHPLLRWLERAPHLFYACFFVITAQMVEDFGSVFELALYLRTIARAILKL